jgi:mannose-6-phosphate isomerase-like protein (cupin superfamily)
VRWDAERDGPPTERALRARLEEWGYGAVLDEYPPGTVFPTHAHAVDKVDAVVSGTFRMSLEGATVDLGPGDALFVPRGTLHSAEVVGTRPARSLDGVRER